jgi:4-coumarate--CoA ligase
MVLSPNHIYIPVLYLSVVGSKRIFSGAYPIYTVQEIAYQLENTGAKALFVHPSLLGTALSAAQKAHLPRERIFQFNDSPSIERDGIKDWFSLLGSDTAAAAYRWPALNPDQARKTIATINYSSGTTGLPKGVMISHANLIANVTQVVYIRDQEMPYNPNQVYRPQNRPLERWCAFLPLYHTYGQLFSCLIGPLLGVNIYVMRKFDYCSFLKAVQDYKITHLQVAPPILLMLARRKETKDYDISSVKYVMCGAAPLSRELQTEVSERYSLAITQGWGMTETTCADMTVPGGAKDNSGSVGLLFPNTEARLIDNDGVEVTEPGVPGELFVRGPQMCLGECSQSSISLAYKTSIANATLVTGYWRNEKATSELYDDGWLRTGDVAKVDSKGWFWIVDRKKELIKVNGLQVAPAELEAVLLEHPDIVDAAVVGITVREEEYPRGYVVLRDTRRGELTLQDIQDWVKSRVAKHKRFVGGIAFVDEVPKLASGKIVRKVLEEWAKKAAPEMEGKILARL